MLDRFFLGQPHPVVLDGDRPRLGIRGDPDARIPLGLTKIVALQPEESGSVQGITGIADQLSEEDLAVRVQGVGDQVENLPDIGFESI